VTLKVYDIQGREVAVLVNEVKQSGIYNVTFDTKELSNGIYFYQIIAGDLIQTRKCLVLK
jgi:G3E family GTPase